MADGRYAAVVPERTAQRLLAWYGRSGRDLPWRNTRDPYRVWVSEIMLQQTGVDTVIPYYQRFLSAFPTVADLAAAPLERVLELWAGLGYYSRARNLHAAARQVIEEHSGSFPADAGALMALPGVGRSTAGAIMSIAFDRPVPILDGNVRRVLCRLYGIDRDPRRRAVENQLWELAAALTPADRPHDYAQAIMDLGATLCTPRRPLCDPCPLAFCCAARASGRQAELPVRGPKKTVPQVVQVALLLSCRGRYLVCRRPLDGMLGGLWEFPAVTLPDGAEAASAAQRLLQERGLRATLREAGQVKHAYSHFRVEVRLFLGEADDPAWVAEGDQRWVSVEALRDWPLHGAHRKALTVLPPEL
ncbi:A/G-specific adenine glycosylase [Desulfuromonas sp. CSMB_57]|jgi:A/G-specific adenine glycosylase|uniref:A/G-specific adenine glycosylase n=1 Tax=Desulfuromonas sp. CSMB_57 TaxID=2807629 RepID=UPI001CD3473C|nr:A/G-specific adenine glycosylase [Desulfuromonas sp. CSMB_57]